MKWSKLRSNMRKAALAATLALAGGGVAHAIVYTGSWDPNFGALLPNLSFTATASLYVPDACVAAGGSSGFIANSSFEGSCISGESGPDFMRLISASVTLTDNRAGGPSETINFLTGYSDAQLASLVFGIYVQFAEDSELDGVLGGLQTDYIGPQAGSIAASKTGETVVNNFFLRFGPEFFGPETGLVGRASVAGEGDPSAPYKLGYLFASPAASAASGVYGVQSNAANGTFAVPEPGALALVLCAIGAAGLATRRRRNN